MVLLFLVWLSVEEISAPMDPSRRPLLSKWQLLIDCCSESLVTTKCVISEGMVEMIHGHGFFLLVTTAVQQYQRAVTCRGIVSSYSPSEGLDGCFSHSSNVACATEIA
jgi:hypothetical protein